MKRRILLIDDDEQIRRLFGLRLSSAGFEVDYAENGDMGVSKARANPPDLIILDVLMPGMDGFETMRTLRVCDETKNVPIVMVTSSSSDGFRDASIRWGADGFATKQAVDITGFLQHSDDDRSDEYPVVEKSDTDKLAEYVAALLDQNERRKSLR